MDVTTPRHLPHTHEQTQIPQVPTHAQATQRRRKPSTPRNFLVFPVQLDQPRPSLEAFPFTTYSAFDLKARHMYDRSLARGIDDIWVDTANYYKQRQSSRHEFIIFSVASGTGMQNFIALDRNGYIQGSSGLGGSGKNKLSFPAQDYFHVSHYGEMESLATHCGRNAPKSQYTHVEHVGFANGALPFAQLLVLVNTISEWEPGYKSTTNDHWFAGLIWECLIGIFESGIVRRKRFSNERGRLKGPKTKGHYEEYHQVTEKYRDDVVTFKSGLGDDAKKSEIIDDSDHKATNAQLPPTGPPKSPKSPFLITTPVKAPRSKFIRGRDIRNVERIRAASLHVKRVNKHATTPVPSAIDPHLHTRLNKELPSLPPEAEPIIRTRAKSLNNSMRGQKRLDLNDISTATSNVHVAATVTHKLKPPSPPHIPREFSWIQVDPNELDSHPRARVAYQARRSNTAYSLPTSSSNSTRIPRGHLNQRTKST